MVYFDTSAEWFEQSSLLLKARPTSTIVSTKYSVLAPTPSRVEKHKKYLAKRAAKSSTTDSSTNPAPEELAPKASFTLKAYDSVSGVCLKYETNKAAEVGRLVGGLGKLGRQQAALPEVLDDLSAPTEGGPGIETPSLEATAKAGPIPAGTTAGSGAEAGKKKKKKGKK